MTYRAFTHIALIVTPLRQAEEFYRALFALAVDFREAEAADGWATLPSEASWDDAEAAGISLGLCSLHRDSFTLALEEGMSRQGGRLSHVGVHVDAQDLERLRTVAPLWDVTSSKTAAPFWSSTTPMEYAGNSLRSPMMILVA